ncbi:MAG: NAD-dependent epimerase/dehydratase family protein [Halioglobus sp.]
MKRSLVTGATGFIGRALCKSLYERGDEVVAISLHGGTLSPQLTVQALDLSSKELLDPSLLRDVDCVYHLAGIAHQSANLETYQAVNVRATLELAAAASEAGVRQFIFLSSVKAMGSKITDSTRAEADVSEIAADVDPYGWSKQHAEQQLLANFSAGAMRIHIVRPALVYGPGVKGNLATLMRASRFSLGRPPSGGLRSMIALPDLVALLMQLEHSTSPGIHTCIAADNEQYSARRLYDALRSAQNLAPTTMTLPGVVWRIMCRLRDLREGAVGGSTWRKLSGTELYSNQKLADELRFIPRLQFEDVATSIVEYEKVHGEGK